MSTVSFPVIQFFFESSVTLSRRTELKKFIRSLFKKEKKPLTSLNYVFCSDQRLLEINRQYLKHDYYTDIITFELADPDSSTIGEIYISVDRVRENAKKEGQALKQELHRVIFHGALHLCGYGDKTSKEEQLMRQKEDHYLDRYFGFT